MSKKAPSSEKNGQNEINDKEQLNNIYYDNHKNLTNDKNNNKNNNKEKSNEKKDKNNGGIKLGNNTNLNLGNEHEDEINNDNDENISAENKTILIKKNKNYIKNNNINNNIPNNDQIKDITQNNNNNIKNNINDKNNTQAKIMHQKEINKIKELNNKDLDQKIINKSELDKKEEKEKKEKNVEKVNILENYLCFNCKEKAYIKLNQKNFTVDMKCVNGHIQGDIPIKEFISKNELNKKKHCQECLKDKISIDELYYCFCKKTICSKCKSEKKHNSHSQIKLSQKYNFCLKHKNEYKCFCLQCNKNICYECFNDHNNHLEFILDFENELPKEKEISKTKFNLDKIKVYKKEFDNKFDTFIEILKNKKKEYDQNFEEFIKIQNNIVNRIENKESLSYEDIDNYSNLKLIDNDKDKIFDFLNNYEFTQEGRLLIDILGRDNSEKNNTNNINNYNNPNKQNNIYKNNNKFGDKNQLNSYKDQNRKFERNNKTNNYSNYNNYKNEIKNKALDKIENCTKILNKKEDKCITCFAILRNNRIVISFKSGILKFYELQKKNNILGINIPFTSEEVQMKEILCLEEEEYCFNYCIELSNGDVAVCSEDSTLKIIKLFFDEETNNNEKYKIIQKIEERDRNPIYIIKELVNKNLVLGCWRNILVYQKANTYELINKIIIDDYTFALLELSPNEIFSAHSNSKTLTIHNLNNYEIDLFENIESNENNNILCKYNNQNDIVFVAYNTGINIVSIIKKCLIQKILIFNPITGLCPMMFNYDIGNGKKEKFFGLLCGEKEKISGQRVNYTYNLVQIGFNLNGKDRGIIDNKDKNVFYETISKKQLIHYYDITNIQNSLFCKNNNTLKISKNKEEQFIFTSGYEDKTINIWKL